MASFEKAIQTTLWHEGRFSDDAADRGGATKFGISSRFLRQKNIKLDIHTLTRESAIRIYHNHFWRYDKFQSQAVAAKVFDIAVNMGPKTAHRILQLSLRGIGIGIKVDGILGPLTIARANGSARESKNLDTHSKLLLKELRARQAVRYAEIVLKRPSQKKFLLGWMRRAIF